MGYLIITVCLKMHGHAITSGIPFNFTKCLHRVYNLPLTHSGTHRAGRRRMKEHAWTAGMTLPISYFLPSPDFHWHWEQGVGSAGDRRKQGSDKGEIWWFQGQARWTAGGDLAEGDLLQGLQSQTCTLVSISKGELQEQKCQRFWK